MLKTPLSHPEILSVLARMGHGSCLLLADGNYPAATGVSGDAAKVYLNLCPGRLDGPSVLETLLSVVPVESALAMAAPDDAPQPIHDEYRRRLPETVPLAFAKRREFYAAARSPDVALAIVTGETRRFANLLLTLGVVLPPAAGASS